MNTSVPVVVLQLFSDPLHHGVLGVTRTLGRLGVPVYVVAPDDRTPTTRSRFAAGIFSWNGLAQHREAIVEFLRDVARRLGERPILIPVDDLGPLVLEDHGDELSESFVFQRQPDGVVSGLVNKWSMSRLASKHGVPTPMTESPMSEADVERVLERMPTPVVLKGAESFVPGTTSRAELVVAATPDEVRRAWGSMSAGERSNLMVQEYIPGGPESIWMFNGYFDARSECRVSFTGRKIRQWPPDTGATSLGVCLPNDEVEQMTVRFLHAIGYRGAIDLGYRYDDRDRQYKLLDVNPRVGSTFRLFVDAAGQMDVVRALYLDLTGQMVPPAAARAGRRWLVEPNDLRSSLAYRRGGRISARDWIASLRGVEEAAWFARDDLRPFGALTLRVCRIAVRRTRQRIRHG